MHGSGCARMLEDRIAVPGDKRPRILLVGRALEAYCEALRPRFDVEMVAA